ncbi:MAG: hypothetical protein FJY99_13345 [Candidatus Sericytochromatia bacterium]|nr:hypothetical protein [Candidatus Tanganyikabacteria bacterium]
MNQPSKRHHTLRQQDSGNGLAADEAEDRILHARALQADPANEQYMVQGLGSSRLIGSDLFVGLGNFDFYTPGAADYR